MKPFLMMLCGAMAMCAAAKKPEPVPLNPQGENLLAAYTEMLDGLKQEIAAAAPTIPAPTTTTFMLPIAGSQDFPKSCQNNCITSNTEKWQTHNLT